MTRATEWRRISFSEESFSFFGYSPGPVLEPGETAIRTKWSFQAWSVWGSTSTYPPGSSILRAGLILFQADATSLDTPVSQPNADWMDITVCPWQTQIAISTNVDWVALANTGPGDRDVKAMRQNKSPTVPMAVWCSWELRTTSDMITGFGFSTSGAVDVLVALA